MAHLKCAACRTRFQTDGRRLSGVREDRCAACNAPLEPPAQLAELVGFQLARLDGPLPDADSDFLAAVAMALTPPDTKR
jgi:hypothetical protein